MGPQDILAESRSIKVEFALAELFWPNHKIPTYSVLFGSNALYEMIWCSKYPRIWFRFREGYAETETSNIELTHDSR